MSKLIQGDRAPGFKLSDQNNNVVSLSDFTGKKLLIYFYPRALTPGCTLQARAVRDALIPLQKVGIQAVGISPDPPSRQKRFDDKYELRFKLLSDPDHQVAEAYGAWGEKAMFGHKKMGIIRSAFLVDESGGIIKSWYRVKPTSTAINALNVLKDSSPSK